MAIGIILGVSGLVFSIIQKRKSFNSWAKAGLVLNIITIVLSIVLLILYFTLVGSSAAGTLGA